MADGSIFGRRKFLSTPDVYSVSLRLTREELVIWRDFVKNTLQDVLSFNAPLVTEDSATFSADGKPTVFTEVYLVSTAFKVSPVKRGVWLVSDIQLRRVY
jgi:hypothetical protein